MLVVFILGYLAIVFEHPLRLNKSASALLTGVLCWTVYALRDRARVAEALRHHLGDIAGILFFLLAAMAVVELIDAHDGFDLITARITTTSRRRLLVVIAAVSFFLSAALDNLTTAIVMTSLVRKLVDDERDRMYLGGVVVIAANAGGAWSPIGDVTTTMLWMGGEVSAGALVSRLFVPSLVSVVVPVAIIALGMKGEVRRSGAAGDAGPGALADALAGLPPDGGRASFALPASAAAVGRSLAEINLRARSGALVRSIARGDEVMDAPSPRLLLLEGDALELAGARDELAAALSLLLADAAPRTTAAERATVFFAGVGALLFVPVFKSLTGLPPVMGVLLGLGALGAITDLLHQRKDQERKSALSVAGALERVDSPSVLFFLGILLAISALESAGLLRRLAAWMGAVIGNLDVVTMAIGFASAVIDNVPLVAAARGMYPHATFPMDHRFWVFLAYCAGTGGSILVIGSAAGIAVMGAQRITFGWYLRHMTPPALLGYLAGALAYVVGEWLRAR
jgi:Na+/H+ antiporter NhaD/arsenite permease-like protein